MSTMEEQFYLTLPSNSSMKLYPNNTLANFAVNLSPPLELSGDWVVALCEIQYPHTWNNVRMRHNVFYIQRGEKGFPERYPIPVGYYKSVQQILKAMMDAVESSTKKDLILTYNSITRHVTIEVKNNLEILLGDGLAPLLGFDNGAAIKKKTESPRVANLAGGFHSLYVYIDVVEAQAVGDTRVPLLRIVNIEGKDGDTITKTFQNPFYLPVSRKYVERISCNIKDDTNQLVPFESGKLIVTLHFKRSKPFYL